MNEHTDECAYVERGEECDCGFQADALKSQLSPVSSPQEQVLERKIEDLLWQLHCRESQHCPETAVIGDECFNCGWHYEPMRCRASGVGGFTSQKQIDSKFVKIITSEFVPDGAEGHFKVNDRVEGGWVMDPSGLTLGQLIAGKKALYSCSEDPEFDDVRKVYAAICSAPSGGTVDG